MGYNRSAGEFDFYRTHNGDVEFVHSVGGQRSSWYKIVPGEYAPGVYTDLLCYDRNAGYARFYRIQ